MKFFGLGVPELVIILIVILLIFGPKNLPKLGAALGKTVKNLRDGMGLNKNDDTIDVDAEVVADDDDTAVSSASKATVAAENADTASAGENSKKVRKVKVVKD